MCSVSALPGDVHLLDVWPAGWVSCLVLFDKAVVAGDLSGKEKQCLLPFLCFLWYQLNSGPLETSTKSRNRHVCVIRWVLGHWFVSSLPL